MIKTCVEKVSVPELFRLWGDKSLRTDEIADRLGVSLGSLWKLKVRHALPVRVGAVRLSTANSGRRHDDPTPEQIAERAAECRAKWPKERWGSAKEGIC